MIRATIFQIMYNPVDAKLLGFRLTLFIIPSCRLKDEKESQFYEFSTKRAQNQDSNGLHRHNTFTSIRKAVKISSDSHHHTRCPLPKPTRPAPTTIPPLQAIKQLKTPILSDLRTHVANFMSSADRILQYVQSDQKNSRKIYQEDRKNLLEYLNSLVIRQIRPANLNYPQLIQNHQASEKEGQTQGTRRLSEQTQTIHNPRKRCKSHDQKQQEKDNYFLSNDQKKENIDQKARFTYMEAQLVKCSSNLEIKSSLLAYTQLVLCKAMLILQETIDQNHHVEGFQHSKIILLATVLSEANNYIQSQSNLPTDILQRLKQEISSMISYLKQLQRPTFNRFPSQQSSLDKDRRWLREKERMERQFEEKQNELRGRILRLTEEIGLLTDDLQRWQSEGNILKNENQSLRQDLMSMEQHIQEVRHNYSGICHQLEEANERLKNLHQVSLAKDDQLAELLADNSTKSRILSQRLQEIQQKQKEISRLSALIRSLELSKAQLKASLVSSTNDLSRQLFAKQSQIKEVESHLKMVQEKCNFLQVEELRQKSRTIELQTRIEALELENRTLYNDVRDSETVQSQLEEDKHTYQAFSKQLVEQCNKYRQEIQGCHRRIKFCEEKLIELANLTQQLIIGKFRQEEKYQKTQADISQQYVPFLLQYQIQNATQKGETDIMSEDGRLKVSTVDKTDNLEILRGAVNQKDNNKSHKKQRQISLKDKSIEQNILKQLPFQMAQNLQISSKQVLPNPLFIQKVPQLINPESIRVDHDPSQLTSQVYKSSLQEKIKPNDAYASERKRVKRVQSQQKNRKEGSVYIRVRKDGAGSSMMSRPRSMSHLHSQV